ncbi:protein N-terminal asparagine amidohydrolase-like [Tropilaelaps mercedesae]|uniref:Protein N-terminal asparagine amidohydrolase-like n=1 Tax=Tropilaelaps mercedesae TaxID=418985 RepID=A0A1V9Y085_9ACAR|nr:protein N-terminal asparagine amidohydrolase-like [Tropilaelaps mercedesae]
MPLVINDQVLDFMPVDTHSLFDRFPHFKDMSSLLVSQVAKVVSPHGLLYVHQRELAVTAASDKHISIIGTDNMTTCQCVIIRHTGNGAVGMGHFEGNGCEDGINKIIHKLHDLSHEQYQYGQPESKQNRFEVTIVGGFLDQRQLSEQISMQLLYALHKQTIRLHLVQMCIGELNTVHRSALNWPLVTGVGVLIKTGEIFPAGFPDKGPELALRSAVFFTGSRDMKHVMFDVYDCSLGLMKVGPFSYEPMRGVDLWLQQSDDFILQNLSTSPEVEPPHFVMNVRATFKYIQQHPFPTVTVFPENRAHFFRKDEHGLWHSCY